MIDYQGWVILHPHWEEEKEEYDKFRSLIEDINIFIKETNPIGTIFSHVSGINGFKRFVFCGAANRMSHEFELLYKLFDKIAKQAPGSHGILYLQDDEGDNIDEYVCFVMRMGRIFVEKDCFFSPVSTMVDGEIDI